MGGVALPNTLMPDGVGDTAVRTLTTGGPTSALSAAARGSEAEVRAVGPGLQKSKWEALLNFPPYRISSKRQVIFVLV